MGRNTQNGGRKRWNPWRHIGVHYPHIKVSCRHILPGTRRASWTKHGIYIDKTLDQVARRCALAHEIVHLERGPVPEHPQLALVEERAVSVIAAQRLIPLEDLTEAVMWVDLSDPHELAEELWVDPVTLKIRLESLRPHEHDHILAELAARQPWTTDN